MKKSLISIRDFSKEEILHVLEVAKEFEKDRVQKILDGKVIACIFFEPSTRTRLSFETAVNRLGAKVIGFSDATNTSEASARRKLQICIRSCLCTCGECRGRSEPASVPDPP